MSRNEGKSATQAERSRARREQILDAAFHTFTRRGYRDTAVDEIAAAADTSKGGVYFHFPTKEAIFRELMRTTADRLADKVERAVAQQTEPIARADAALRTVLLTFAGHRTMARLLFVDAMGAGRVFNAETNALHDRFAAMIAGYLDDAVAAGTIPPIDTGLTGVAWFGALNEVVARWLLVDDPEPLESVYPTLRALLLRSVGVPEARIADQLGHDAVTVVDRRAASTDAAVETAVTALLAASRGPGPRRLGTATLAIAPLDPIDLFAAARALDLEAALWLQPAADRSIVGVGRAWAVEAAGPGRFVEAAEAWRGVLADAVRMGGAPDDGDGEVGPVLLGGLGFSGDAARSRGPVGVVRSLVAGAPDVRRDQARVVRDADRGTRRGSIGRSRSGRGAGGLGGGRPGGRGPVQRLVGLERRPRRRRDRGRRAPADRGTPRSSGLGADGRPVRRCGRARPDRQGRAGAPARPPRRPPISTSSRRFGTWRGRRPRARPSRSPGTGRPSLVPRRSDSCAPADGRSRRSPSPDRRHGAAIQPRTPGSRLALLASEKDREEHAVVVDMLRASLGADRRDAARRRGAGRPAAAPPPAPRDADHRHDARRGRAARVGRPAAPDAGRGWYAARRRAGAHRRARGVRSRLVCRAGRLARGRRGRRDDGRPSVRPRRRARRRRCSRAAASWPTRTRPASGRSRGSSCGRCCWRSVA